MSPERDDNIYDRVARLSELLAVAAEREKHLADEIEVIKEQVNELNSVLAKGRGALLVLVTLGSLLGLIIGVWDKIVKVFTGN